MKSTDSLRHAGRAIAEEQDRLLADRAAIDDARARLFESAPRARDSLGLWRLGGLLGGAAVAAAVLLVLRGQKRSLQFEASGSPGQVDAWLAADTTPVPLRFSDGTTIDLAPATRARVAKVHEQGARVVIERGRAQVAVVHRPGASWLVNAGPFEVRVTGTKFSVEWDAAREVFQLAMQEGSVAVSSPCHPGIRHFRAGETISLGCRSPGPAPSGAAVPPVASSGTIPSIYPEPPDIAPPPSAPTVSARGPEVIHPRGIDAPPALAPSASASAPPSPDAPAPPGWKELAASRRYKEALTEAENAGFDGLCASLGASDLALLGDIARFSGNSGRALQALTALRRRFPGDGHAATAAFTLGRLAFDQRGAHAEAAGWFSTYLSEQPGGPFAREALGRLMEARQRSGDAEGARHAAQQYLARFPGGAHEPLARRLAEAPGSP